MIERSKKYIAIFKEKFRNLHLNSYHTISKNVDDMINDIDKWRTIKYTSENHTHFLCMYIRELWVTELDGIEDKDATIDICTALFEDVNILKIEKMISDLFPNLLNKRKSAQELLNIYSACVELFKPTEDKDKLNIPFIKKIHSLVMKDLLSCDKVGVFRKTNVRALSSEVVYCTPSAIETKLQSLCDFINSEKIENTKDAIRLASLFFSEFLLIHPFIDGNGRTARLLLSYILRKVSVVPVSLYIGKNPKTTYLEVLESRNDQNFPPDRVASFILACVYRTCNDCYYLLN